MKISLIPLCLLGAFLTALPLAAQDEESKTDDGPKKIYIPANPKAADYIISQLSNKELVQAPRVEPVFNAFLKRKGLDAKYREEALAGLAALHKTDRLTELLAALERLDALGSGSAVAITDLGPFLARSKPADLTAKKSALENLRAKAKLRETRCVVSAGLITADGKADAVWEQAAKDNARLTDLVCGVPLVMDATLRTSFQPRLSPLAQKAATPDLQRQAIQALPAMKGHEAANFAALASLIRAGTERATAVRSLLQLPRSAWQKDQAGPVAQSLIEHAAKVPTDQRTGQDFLDAMQLGNDLSLLLPSDEGRRIRKALGELGVRVIVLKTLHEQMFFDKTRLVVEAGKPVEIIFENPDAMPHNFVITAPGAREEIGKLADAMPQEADEEGRMYIPKSPKVLYGSKLVDPGASLKLNFTAPDAPGEYTYVCTFPGHWARMFGTLVVTTDIEDYLAKNPEQEAPKITEWKTADLAADLKRVDQHRNFASGKALFNSLACAQCHQLGKEGTAFGPNLSGVLGRWKNDRQALLEQILDPSKVIDDKFRAQSLELGDENFVSGIVLAEDAETVTVQTGPSEAAIQKVKKSAIKSRSKEDLSRMPAGLLNMLNKEQILDLLAYLLAEGSPDHAAFKHDH